MGANEFGERYSLVGASDNCVIFDDRLSLPASLNLCSWRGQIQSRISSRIGARRVGPNSQTRKSFINGLCVPIGVPARPEYQAPNEAPKTTGNLDLGEAPALPATATIIP
jgi:hypothetical protein